MIRAILFDKDGTLVDFNATWLAPYQEASAYLAASVGRPELADELMRKGGYVAETGRWAPDSLLASGSNGQIFDFWAAEIGAPMDGERRRAVDHIFARAANAPAPAVDDLKGCLERLKNRSLTLGVATMDDEANARAMINGLGLASLFDFICGGDSGHGVKPEPGMVQAFCRHRGVEAGEVLMVGDSPKDMNMGRNAGAGLSVGVLTGAHDRAELSTCADHVIPDIRGLEQFV